MFVARTAPALLVEDHPSLEQFGCGPSAVANPSAGVAAVRMAMAIRAFFVGKVPCQRPSPSPPTRAPPPLGVRLARVWVPDFPVGSVLPTGSAAFPVWPRPRAVAGMSVNQERWRAGRNALLGLLDI